MSIGSPTSTLVKNFLQNNFKLSDYSIIETIMINRGGLKTFNHKEHKLLCKLVKRDKETIHFSIAQSRQNPTLDICFSLANTVLYIIFW